jgi:hypothetical protein
MNHQRRKRSPNLSITKLIYILHRLPDLNSPGIRFYFKDFLEQFILQSVIKSMIPGVFLILDPQAPAAE